MSETQPKKKLAKKAGTGLSDAATKMKTEIAIQLDHQPERPSQSIEKILPAKKSKSANVRTVNPLRNQVDIAYTFVCLEGLQQPSSSLSGQSIPVAT
jgi:hypothetical protein